MAASETLVGKTLKDKYHIVSRLGSGAMGTVYECEHTGLKRRMALKILHPDLNVNEETLARFQQEGVAAGRIQHPCTIEIFDFDRTEQGHVFLAMEFVEGRSLKSLLLDQGAFSVDDSIEITRQILSALEAAHKEGIVHRDLKPENIMVRRDSEGTFHVKVLDFGISKLVETGSAEEALMTQTGRIIGTPQYMAPEQCGGTTVDHRADLYSVGLILFEMIAGRPPFQGATVTEILMKHSTEESPSVGSVADLSVPRDLERLLAKSLRKNRDERYANATEMLDALGSIDFDRTVKLKGPIGGGSSGASLRKIGMGLAAVVVVALAAFGALQAFKGGGGSSSKAARVRLKDPERRNTEEAEYVRQLDLAIRELKARNVPGALDAVEQAMSLGCRDAEAFVVRGRVFLERNDPQTAKLDFQEAVRMDEEFAMAESYLGRAYLDEGDVEQALSHFQRAVEIDPELGVGYEGLGLAAYDNGDLEQAKESLMRAVSLDRGLADAHLVLARIQLREGDVQSAEGSLREAKRNDPRVIETYEALGQIHESRGELELAERQYLDALDIDSESSGALVSLATILVGTGRYDDAEPRVREALRLDPDNGRARILLGSILYDDNDVAGAIEALEIGVATSPDEFEATLLLGILYQSQGRSRDAITQYLTANALDESRVEPIKNLGLAYIAEGNPEQARDRLEEAYALDEDDAITCYALGFLYRDQFGDDERARELLRRYRDLGGADPVALSWLDN